MDDNKEEYFVYLDNLRDSGVTNMFGAAPYLMSEFGLQKKEADSFVLEWMDTYNDRHKD